MSSDYLPSPAAVEQIGRDLAAYEAERQIAHKAVRWRVPVFVGIYAIVAAGAFAVAWNLSLMQSSDFVGLLIVGAIVLGAYSSYEFALRPATILQESFRGRLLPLIFGFIKDLRHERRGTPATFANLPKAATGEFNRSSFDDVISGRMKQFQFEIYETQLDLKHGKSSSMVFKGVVLAFSLACPFEGRLFVTRRIAKISRFFRDAFGDGGLTQMQTGNPVIDEVFEFRTDNMAAAEKLVGSRLVKALDWLRDAWPDGTVRLALSETNGFLLLPVESHRDFFELPGIKVPLVYSAHVAPIIADMGKILEIGALVKKAAELP